jgi:hypothetical protein
MKPEQGIGGMGNGSVKVEVSEYWINDRLSSSSIAPASAQPVARSSYKLGKCMSLASRLVYTVSMPIQTLLDCTRL